VELETLLARLRDLERKHARKKEAVRSDLAKIEAAPRFLYETELLKSARPKRFDAFVEVMDYGADPPQPIRIALEPGKSLQEQVEKRFKLGRRLLAAEGKAIERLTAIDAEEQRLIGAKRQLDTIVERGAAEAAIAAFLAVHGELFARAPARAKGAVERAELPYREYWSASGRAIWVGKSGRKNDLLTFKHASPHAQWLHASGYAGTHVVVQKKRGEALDPQTLDDAARLAAHFSKAPEGVAVEVSVTEVKFVRKFRGANTGQVRIERETHRLVDNDPARVKAILARRPGSA
jgi:predicted ribosome quality control (RQC) complex YloA/Tae2 family protein